MDLLLRTFPVESAFHRLKNPQIEHIVEDGDVINKDEINTDIIERMAAQEIIDNAGRDVMINAPSPLDPSQLEELHLMLKL